jgi:hypothetical protein
LVDIFTITGTNYYYIVMIMMTKALLKSSNQTANLSREKSKKNIRSTSEKYVINIWTWSKLLSLDYVLYELIEKTIIIAEYAINQFILTKLVRRFRDILII